MNCNTPTAARRLATSVPTPKVATPLSVINQTAGMVNHSLVNPESPRVVKQEVAVSPVSTRKPVKVVTTMAPAKVKINKTTIAAAKNAVAATATATGPIEVLASGRQTRQKIPPSSSTTSKDRPATSKMSREVVDLLSSNSDVTPEKTAAMNEGAGDQLSALRTNLMGMREVLVDTLDVFTARELSNVDTSGFADIKTALIGTSSSSSGSNAKAVKICENSTKYANSLYKLLWPAGVKAAVDTGLDGDELVDAVAVEFDDFSAHSLNISAVRGYTRYVYL